MEGIKIKISQELDQIEFNLVKQMLIEEFPNQKVFFSGEQSTSPDSVFVVAKHPTKAKVVGFCSVHLYVRVSGICTAIIEDVVVPKRYKRKKIGSLIINSALRFATARANKVILQASPENTKFYESCGFNEYDNLITFTKYPQRVISNA